jgi:hypothetical protein
MKRYIFFLFSIVSIFHLKCSIVDFGNRVDSIFKSIIEILIKKRKDKIQNESNLKYEDLEFFFFDKNGIEQSEDNGEKLNAIVEYDNYSRENNNLYYCFNFTDSKSGFLHDGIRSENRFYPININSNQMYFALISRNKDLNKIDESGNNKKYKVLALSRCSFSCANGMDYLCIELFSSLLHGQYLGEILMFFIFKCAFFENEIDYIILDSVPSACEFYKKIGFQISPINANNVFYIQKWMLKNNIFRLLNENNN